MIVSERCRNINPSATLEIAAKAQALRDEGHDIIFMNTGQPDADTPLHIKAAAMEGIQEGNTKYTEVGGTQALKNAICEKLLRENGLQYTTQEVMASTGAKQAIFNAFMATLNKGDEVIIQAPYWTSYPDMIKLANADPVIIPTSTDSGFKLKGSQLANAITPYTKMIILNSPNNPSGVYYTEEDLQMLANVLVDHPKILILSDDVYEKILWQQESFKNIVNVVPSFKDRTIVINSLSKTYAMTGWRLGYVAASEEVIQAMTKLQSQTTSNPCSISQSAAIAALSKHSQSSIDEMVSKYQARSDFIQERLRKLPGVSLPETHSTFYVLPDMSGLIKILKLKNDVELCQFFLDNASVSTVPGSAFGAPDHIRFSFAIGKSIIDTAFNKIEKAIQDKIDS
ncbi:MAG: pyridoxal phosphate-dependent aminotransferase [Pseudomonadota bacterium]|nr:pyridoxal phosphate-dependent aminotransferase [Pseudomonadota bacterium]